MIVPKLKSDKDRNSVLGLLRVQIFLNRLYNFPEDFIVDTGNGIDMLLGRKYTYAGSTVSPTLPYFINKAYFIGFPG